MSNLTSMRPINKILNPRKESYLFEDFMSQVTNASLGNMGWSLYSGANGFVDSAPAADYDSTALGMIVLSSDTGGIPAHAAVALNPASVGVGFVSGGTIIFETRVKINTLRTVAEEYALYLGMGNNLAAETIPTAGIFFQYSVDSTFWQAKSIAAGTTTVTSAVTVAINTWYRLRAEVNAAGTRIDFYVDDVNIGNTVTNIPNTNAYAFPPSLKLGKTAGTAVENRCLVDYYTLYKKFSPTR